MLLPFDLGIWPEDFAKEVKFGRAKPLARGGRGTDGTVVFHKKKASVRVGRNLGHVALVASDSSQLLKPLFEWSGRRDPPGIRRLQASAARFQHSLQAFFAKRIAHGCNERNVKFSIRIREKPIGLRRELPVLGGATDGDRTLIGRHESFRNQFVEMLANGHRRNPQSIRQLRRG